MPLPDVVQDRGSEVAWVRHPVVELVGERGNSGMKESWNRGRTDKKTYHQHHLVRLALCDENIGRDVRIGSVGKEADPGRRA